MVVVLISLHIIFAMLLIVFVLLHRGQGGGLSDMFGGGGGALQGSAVVEKNLDRITVGVGIGFIVVDIALVKILSS